MEWPSPVCRPVEGLGENVPEGNGSMSVGLVGERRRRFCGVDRAAPLLLLEIETVKFGHRLAQVWQLCQYARIGYGKGCGVGGSCRKRQAGDELVSSGLRQVFARVASGENDCCWSLRQTELQVGPQ